MLIVWPRFHLKRVREYLIGDFLAVSFIRYSRDQDIGVKCEGLCELEYVDCISSCSGTDCLIECGRTLTDCTNGNYFFPKFHRQKLLQIARVMNIVQMVAPTVQIRFVSVARILRLRMNSIWNDVERKKVLIWDRALFNVIMIKIAKIYVSILSKTNMKSVPVRYCSYRISQHFFEIMFC